MRATEKRKAYEGYRQAFEHADLMLGGIVAEKQFGLFFGDGEITLPSN